jgi:hypothetical protein
MQNLNMHRASTPKKKGVTIDSRIVDTTTMMITTIAIVATVAAITDAENATTKKGDREGDKRRATTSKDA